LPRKTAATAAAALLAALAISLPGQDIPQEVTAFELPSARFTGFGGSHAAIADDEAVFFSNPAGFAAFDLRLTLAQLLFDVKNVDTMAKLYFGESPTLDSFLSNSLEAGLELAGPVALIWLDRGLGLGLFNTTRLDITWDPDNAFEVDVYLNENVIAAAGYAWRFGGIGRTILDAGLEGKLFYRAGFLTTGLGIVGVRYFHEDLANYPFQTQLGLGVDAGFRLTYDQTFSWALACRDAFSPVLVTNYTTFDSFQRQLMQDSGASRVVPAVDTGLAWRFPDPGENRFVSDIVFALDFHGLYGLLAGGGRSPLLDVGAGLEICLLDALRLRAGWYEMLPGGGLGLDMTSWRMDFSLYGKEYGTEPGQRPSYSFAASFVFRG